MASLATPYVRQRFGSLLRRGMIGPLRRYLPTDSPWLTQPSRATVYSAVVVLWGLVIQAFDRAASDRAATYRLAAWLGLELSPRSGALCKARARLGAAPLRDAARHVASLCLARGKGLRRRRRVLLLDATGLSVADTPANRAFYGLPAHRRPGCGYPVLALAVLMDDASGAVVDWASGPYGTPELLLAQPLLASLQPGDVLVADQLYGTYGFVAALTARGVDMVIRQHHRRINPQRPAGATDWVETWPHPGGLHELHREVATAPSQTLRIVAAERSERDELLLVTTLTPREASADLVRRLYRDRWRIETQLGQLKTQGELDFLPARSPAGVEVRLAAAMLALNLLCAWRLEAARALGVDAWRLSLTGLRDGLRAMAGVGGSGRAQRAQLLACARGEILPDRPGRSEPRVIKTRAKPFPLMTSPRHELRARLAAGR